jgi:hypothetical protein
MHARLALATALVFVAHLIFVAVGPTIPVVFDAAFYDASALSLAAGTGFSAGSAPEASLMPGYSLFLAGIYTIFGHRLWVVYAIQSLLVSLAASGLFLIVGRQCGPRPAAVAYLSLALFPMWFLYPLFLGAEPLLLVAQVAFFAATLRPARDVRWAAGSGATCGILTLVKPEFFLWLLLPTILAGKTRALRTLIVSAVSFAIVLSPWIARNEHAFAEFIPLTTRSGSALWLSAHAPELTEFTRPEFVAADARCNIPNAPKATDDCLAREARAMIADHPAYFIRTSFSRLLRTLVGSHTEQLPVYSMAFSDAIREKRFDVLSVKVPLLLINAIFVGGGLLGILFACRDRRYWFLIYLVASKLAVCAVFFGTARYGLHLSPILAGGWALLTSNASRRIALSASQPEVATT